MGFIKCNTFISWVKRLISHYVSPTHIHSWACLFLSRLPTVSSLNCFCFAGGVKERVAGQRHWWSGAFINTAKGNQWVWFCQFQTLVSHISLSRCRLWYWVWPFVTHPSPPLSTPHSVWGTNVGVVGAVVPQSCSPPFFSPRDMFTLCYCSLMISYLMTRSTFFK